MDYTTCYCRSRRCSMFGRIGSSAQLKLHDWQRGGPRFRCQVCGEIVSASTGTAYAGIRSATKIAMEMNFHTLQGHYRKICG